MIFCEKKQSTLYINAHTKQIRRASPVLQWQKSPVDPKLLWAENSDQKCQFSYANHSFIKRHFGLLK